MKRFTAFVLLVLGVALAAVSCKKEEETGKLSFDVPAVYMQPGQTVQVGFSATDIRSYSITARPTGWDTENFTVDGETLTSAFALDTDGDFTPDSEEAVFDGAFHESYFQSAPYFAIKIDGIEWLNSAF